jgi:hypothetical protein
MMRGPGLPTRGHRVLLRLLRPWLGVEWLVLRGGLFPRRLAHRPGHSPRWVRLEARLCGAAIGQLDIIALEGRRRRLRLALPKASLWRRMAIESLAEAAAASPYAAWPRLWEAATTASDRGLLVLAGPEHE